MMNFKSVKESSRCKAYRHAVFVLLTWVVLALGAQGQNTKQIIYFNDQGKQIKTQEGAKFRREFEAGLDGKAVGAVKDYYPSGELWRQCAVLGNPSVAGTRDVEMRDGKCTWYFKSGKIQSTVTYSKGTFEGESMEFYETGTKSVERLYSKDRPVGKWVGYHPSGKVAWIIQDREKFESDPWFTECDEAQECERVFQPILNDEQSWKKLGWSGRNVTVTSSGLLLKAVSNSSAFQLFNVSLDPGKNFSIEVEITHVKGDEDSWQGIEFGRKDKDNLNVFYINGDGYYSLGSTFKGITQRKGGCCVAEDHRTNVLRVTRLGNKVLFSNNGNVKYVDENGAFSTFFGSGFGLWAWGDSKEVLISKIRITEDEVSRVTATDSGTGWTGSGTGFFVDQRGYIVTNHHVVEKAKAVEVSVLQDGELKTFPAAVLAKDKASDLAIIKIEDEKFKPLGPIPYGINFGSVDVGTSVFTLGFPATQILGEEVKFTDGKISSKTGFQGDITSYQISVPAQPGNSGGPLFDDSGNLVGVVNSGVRALENVTYAVKTIYLAAILDSLPSRLNLPKESATSGMKDVDRIRKVRDYVVKIKVRE